VWEISLFMDLYFKVLFKLSLKSGKTWKQINFDQTNLTYQEKRLSRDSSKVCLLFLFQDFITILNGVMEVAKSGPGWWIILTKVEIHQLKLCYLRLLPILFLIKSLLEEKSVIVELCESQPSMLRYLCFHCHV
jgi:hypothetical protein